MPKGYQYTHVWQAYLTPTLTKGGIFHVDTTPKFGQLARLAHPNLKERHDIVTCLLLYMFYITSSGQSKQP